MLCSEMFWGDSNFLGICGGTAAGRDGGKSAECLALPSLQRDGYNVAKVWLRNASIEHLMGVGGRGGLGTQGFFYKCSPCSPAHFTSSPSSWVQLRSS